MKARSIVILIITLLFSISAANGAEVNQGTAGIWYLEAFYAPEMGSFGEDYAYAAEYGITEMLIILKDGSIEIRHLIYDDRFSEETQPEIMKKLNEIGEISIEIKDGYRIDGCNITISCDLEDDNAGTSFPDCFFVVK